MNIQELKDAFQFSNDTGQPFYSQLASFFKVQIQAGILKPGEQMIAENDICSALGISRSTVRQALNQLVEEGLIIRQRGRGSFIAEKKITRSFNYLYNFTDDIKELGATPHSIVLFKGVTDELPSDVEKAFNFPARQMKAFHLVRIRCADQKPMLVEDTYVPYYLCEGIEKYDFSIASFYQLMTNEYHLELYHAKEIIEAVVIDKKNAGLLQCKSGIAGYKIQRISYLKSGYVYEYTTSISRSGRYVFQVDLYQNDSNRKNSIDFSRQMNL